MKALEGLRLPAALGDIATAGAIQTMAGANRTTDGASRTTDGASRSRGDGRERERVGESEGFLRALRP